MSRYGFLQILGDSLRAEREAILKAALDGGYGSERWEREQAAALAKSQEGVPVVTPSTTREEILADFAGTVLDAFGDATTADEFLAELAAGRAARKQVAELGDFILRAIPGEPSHSQGAVETAIRLLSAWHPLPAADPKPLIGMSLAAPFKPATDVVDDVSYDLFRRIWPTALEISKGTGGYAEYSVGCALGLARIARAELEEAGIVRPHVA